MDTTSSAFRGFWLTIACIVQLLYSSHLIRTDLHVREGRRKVQIGIKVLARFSVCNKERAWRKFRLHFLDSKAANCIRIKERVLFGFSYAGLIFLTSLPNIIYISGKNSPRDTVLSVIFGSPIFIAGLQTFGNTVALPPLARKLNLMKWKHIHLNHYDKIIYRYRDELASMLVITFSATVLVPITMTLVLDDGKRPAAFWSCFV